MEQEPCSVCTIVSHNIDEIKSTEMRLLIEMYVFFCHFNEGNSFCDFLFSSLDVSEIRA